MGMFMGYSKVFRYDQSGRLICESKTSEYYNELDSYESIVYLYDENSIVGMDYTANGQTNTYYFQRNLLGDVVGIYSTSGTKVGGYVYDAWGNCTITLNTNGIASLNPIRYRGYNYDTETGLYYLNARYYSPEWRRFISPDDAVYLDPEAFNGLNLYAYCNNDPVNYKDPSGCFPVLACILALTALIGMGLTVAGVTSDDDMLTAVGLTMVAAPAIVSGGVAVFATTGALATWLGAGTMLAGIGTGLFASAEYQEAATGNNWMIDAGMSEEWYNGVMFTTALFAIAGTFLSSFAYSFNIDKITELGKIKGSKYPGMKFTQIKDGRRVYKSLEFHYGHAHGGHSVHWQLNKWSKAGVNSRGGVEWWTMLLTRIR
jgi:RHS repeat-associated protein